MKRETRSRVMVFCVLLACVTIAPFAAGQTVMEVNYTWTPPTSGSPVHHYVVQHSVNGGPFVQVGTTSTNTYTLTATVGDSHQIRVAGVDSENRQGPFSAASEPYNPDIGPPGQPGRPIPVF